MFGHSNAYETEPRAHHTSMTLMYFHTLVATCIVLLLYLHESTRTMQNIMYSKYLNVWVHVVIYIYIHMWVLRNDVRKKSPPPSSGQNINTSGLKLVDVSRNLLEHQHPCSISIKMGKRW